MKILSVLPLLSIMLLLILLLCVFAFPAKSDADLVGDGFGPHALVSVIDISNLYYGEKRAMYLEVHIDRALKKFLGEHHDSEFGKEIKAEVMEYYIQDLESLKL